MSSPIIHAGGLLSGGGVGVEDGADSSAERAPAGALCDDIDPQTGELRTMFSRVHPVDGAIRFAFGVRNGSGASVQSVGNRYHLIRKKDQTLQRQLTDEADRVLRPFVQRQLVTERDKVTETDDKVYGSDGAAQLITYTNRLTGASQPQVLP